MKNVILKLIMIVGLLVLLAAVWLWKNYEEQRTPVTETGNIKDEQKTDSQTEGVIVTATHTYLDGVHRLEGVAPVPTPCHELMVDATVAESYPEQVTVRLETKPPAEGVFCAQVIDNRVFAVEFTASENPVIRALYNEESVPIVIDDKSGKLQPINP